MKEGPQGSYIFPPFPLLNEVVSRLVKQDHLDFILIAPLASHNSPMWYPLLMDILTEEPVELGRISEVCRLATGKPPKIPGRLAAFHRSRSLRKL